MQIPTLTTERLLLRAHTLDDFEALAAIWADPDVTRFIGGKASTREESWQRLLRYAGFWQLLGIGFWALEEKASGRFMGELGFADFHRDVTPSFDGEIEMGWSLAPWAHAKGFGSEGLTAALAWGDATLKRDFVCMISPENAPSLSLAGKFGFREYARTEYKAAPTVLLRRAKPRVIPGLT